MSLDELPQDQVDIQREMVFTDWNDACKDAHITPDNQLRECRRAKRHAPPHAAGYGNRFEQWYDRP